MSDIDPAEQAKQQLFHSSVYAEAARGDQIGSTNQQTFANRTWVERNRQAVRQYRDSMVARGHMQHHRQTPLPPRPRDPFAPTKRLNGAISPGSRDRVSPTPQQSTPRPHFVEPPARRYNPYG